MNSAISQKVATKISRRPLPHLAEPIHSNPLVNRLLSARGVRNASELNCALADLPRPGTLPDIGKAVDRLLQARDGKERIVIVGDYDCDGATSTSVAILGLTMLGFESIHFLIPSRFEFGYGLSEPIVDIAVREHDAQLIITVDNGVASVEAVAHAGNLGVDVVVTDHHLPPQILPLAIAIVNPVLSGSDFPSRNLAGVGVIFYLLLAIRARLASNDPQSRAPLAELLDLVAIGTVADLVSLDSVNRILVEQGLRRIRAGQTRAGVRALLDVSGKDARFVSTADIGFGIGPRLNAAGRLDDMRVGVQCLISECDTEAKSLAAELNNLNQKRRAIEGDMQTTADEQLAALTLDREAAADAFGLCLLDPTWHQGVTGILAGRIKEQLHLPIVAFTRDGPSSLKGSARSIPGVHIRDVLQSIDSSYPGMIEKFGGHAMAAGLTISSAQFEMFQQVFNETVKQVVDGRRRDREFLTDGGLNGDERTIGNAQLLSRLMPWGQGFEPPLFDDEFTVRQSRIVAERHLKLTLVGSENEVDNRPVDAIAFNCATKTRSGDVVQIVYSLDVNHWRGADTLQLRVHHLEVVAMR